MVCVITCIQQHGKHAVVLTVHSGPRRVMHVLTSHCQPETAVTGAEGTGERSGPVITGPTGLASRRGLPVLIYVHRLADSQVTPESNMTHHDSQLSCETRRNQVTLVKGSNIPRLTHRRL